MKKLAYQLKAVTRWIFTLTFPIALVIFLEAPDIMTLLKPEYMAGAPILQILALSQLASVMVGPVAVLLTMTHYAHLNLIDLFLTLILSFALDLILIPKYDAYGAAIAGTISIIFVNTLRLIQVYLKFGIHPYSWSTFKSIIAGGVATIATLASRQLLGGISPLWRLITLSSLLFFTYVVAMITLRQEEVDSEIINILFLDLTGQKRSKADSL